MFVWMLRSRVRSHRKSGTCKSTLACGRRFLDPIWPMYVSEPSEIWDSINFSVGEIQKTKNRFPGYRHHFEVPAALAFAAAGLFIAAPAAWHHWDQKYPEHTNHVGLNIIQGVCTKQGCHAPIELQVLHADGEKKVSESFSSGLQPWMSRLVCSDVGPLLIS